jgi:hypothetical protein
MSILRWKDAYRKVLPVWPGLFCICKRIYPTGLLWYSFYKTFKGIRIGGRVYERKGLAYFKGVA